MYTLTHIGTGHEEVRLYWKKNPKKAEMGKFMHETLPVKKRIPVFLFNLVMVTVIYILFLRN